VSYVKQEPLHKTYDDATLQTYYTQNKTHFKEDDGKILPFEKAKEAVAKELDHKATKDQALRTYIAFKKSKLETQPLQAEISQSNNNFGDDAYAKVSQLSLAAPYAKPVEVKGVFYIFKLEKVVPAQAKTFAQAKAEVLPLYKEQMKQQKLLEVANNSLQTFKGEKTDFITIESTDALKNLSQQENMEFLQALFQTNKKRSFVQLKSGKIVLYSILEQKLLSKKAEDNKVVKDMKSAIFNEGLLKTLQTKYPTEIFIKGL
jgi:peptidyl-prolyl cis-trans isomerase D